MGASTFKVVIQNRTLSGSRGDAINQRVRTVYLEHGIEYRVYAPPKAVGDSLEWVGYCVVRTQSKDAPGFFEVDVDEDERQHVLKVVKEELERIKRDENRPVGMNPDGIYYDAHICLHGHVLSSGRLALNPSEYCQRCGSPVITDCQDCKSPIRGIHRSSDVHYRCPDFCHGCGSPYPWMREAMDTARELLYHDEKLGIDEKNKLWGQLKYVMSDPKSTLAPAKKKLIEFDLAKAATVTREFVLDAIARIAVEATKG